MNEMRTEQKTNVKNSVWRLIFVAVSLLVQVAWFLVMIFRLNSYSTLISIATTMVALFAVIKIYGKNTNSSFKVLWIMIIMAYPVLGGAAYFLLGRSGLTHKAKQHFQDIDATLEGILVQDGQTFERLMDKDMGVANQSRYINTCAGYPVYDNTDVTYYSEAYEGLEAQKQELKAAKRFIFMEYHAIEDKESFAGIREILMEKAREGVEVRLLYDDVGSLFFINKKFKILMEEAGVKCRVFNPVMPFLNMFMNNRDHRKITVIDGKVGFTGGYNLANEYFNVTSPYGYWKDTGVKLVGGAVNSLTIMFLEMWNSVRMTDKGYDHYITPARQLYQNFLADSGKVTHYCGYVQPYADSPLDAERVGENVYMNVIKNAKHYVYFMTPYLIITDEMSRELRLAAKRGIDVRIITPGIPDKKIVYKMTRSYYPVLVKDGVRIFEYTPGFCHGKMCISDDCVATVGTINLDYRSLYLHFENGVFLYDCPAIAQVRRDFDETFPQCREVTEKYKSGSAALRFGQCILRMFAPLA